MFVISDHYAMKRDWDSKDVEAEILSSHNDAEYRGMICVIKSTRSLSTCAVWVISSSGHQIISVRYEDLKPVRPEKTHKVV